MDISMSKTLTLGLKKLYTFLEKNHEIFENSEFQEVYKRINSRQREMWNILVNVARNIGEPRKQRSDFLLIMEMIRHNLVFHYYQSPKLLREGFISFFYKYPELPYNKDCYYTAGDSMRDTRFYFSDAAVQGSIYHQVSEKMKYEDYTKEFRGAIETANFAIKAIMVAYIIYRRNRPQ